jgi:hypothetical protein
MGKIKTALNVSPFRAACLSAVVHPCITVTSPLKRREVIIASTLEHRTSSLVALFILQLRVGGARSTINVGDSLCSVVVVYSIKLLLSVQQWLFIAVVCFFFLLS